MPTPLAPLVHGPILPSSTHVPISGVLSNARATVLAGGNEVGTAVALSNGNLLVKLDRSLSVGEQVTAVQELGGVTSAPTNWPVTVIDVPSPLPAPTFVSPVTECMVRVLLGALVPGATVTLKRGATVIATFDATGTNGWAAFSIGFSAGQVITAVQQIGGLVSAVASSPPLARVDRKHVPPPTINQPLVACDTAVLASNMVPAGELEIATDHSTQTWTNVAETYWATGVTPLSQGKIKARQRLPGCGVESNVVDIPVGPPVVPPAPIMQPFCPDAKRIVVAGLKAGGVLTIWSKVYNQPAETEIGSIGIGASVEQVDLPNAIGGQGDLMVLVARQSACGLTSPAGESLEFARPGSGALPPPTPRIVAPLYACMRAIPATNLFNGVLTQGFSARHGNALTDPMIVTTPTTRLPTWFPLVAGDEVVIRQNGCSAPAETAVEPVKSLPVPLPIPKIREPVRPGERNVVVQNCLPGSRVHLLVDWTIVATSDQTWTGEAVCVAPAPLTEGQKLWAIQTMCLMSSSNDGDAVVVKKGRLTLSVAPDSAPGGKSISFMVEARDQDTGNTVNGLPVRISGTQVGATGAAFGFTLPTSGSSVSGQVSGGIAYNNATFSIAIRQAIPVVLNLFPGPTVVPYKVWQTDVVWTLTPRWSGAAPVTVHANVGTAMIPPPPTSGATVGVAVSLKAHLQGEIEGIVWPYEPIDIGGSVAELALTGSQHAVAARFSYGTGEVAILDEEGNVTGYETRVFARVDLFSIT